jgi:hypothetical protein
VESGQPLPMGDAKMAVRLEFTKQLLSVSSPA